jgi:phosphatidylglycerophosphate synthase
MEVTLNKRPNLSYEQYLEKAFPESKKELVQHLSFMSKVYHFFADRPSYIAWKMGVSANQISTFRIFLVIFAFIILTTLTGEKFLWIKLGAIVLLFWAKMLDYVDGFIARVNGTSSKLGANLDAFSDLIVLQGMTLALIGYYTEIVFFIPFAVALQWVIHSFGQPFKDPNYNPELVSPFRKKIATYFLDTGFSTVEHQTNNTLEFYSNVFCKVLKSDVFHFMIIPTLIAIFNSEKWNHLFSNMAIIIIMIYTIVAGIRLKGGLIEYSRQNS